MEAISANNGLDKALSFLDLLVTIRCFRAGSRSAAQPIYKCPTPDMAHFFYCQHDSTMNVALLELCKYLPHEYIAVNKNDYLAKVERWQFSGRRRALVLEGSIRPSYLHKEPRRRNSWVTASVSEPSFRGTGGTFRK